MNPFNSQLQVVAAAGRILSPDKDQVVYAWRDDYNALVIVEIQPYGGASLTGIGLPRLVDRPFTAGFTDPLDIAVADLDKRPDASGNNHDEVVVAYASPTANANRWAVNVAVLDYTSDAANNYAHPVAVTKTNSAAFGQIDASVINNTSQSNVLLPVESILKTAVGDFDGDGVSEIAVVFFADQNTLVVRTFHYEVDASGNRSVVELNYTPYNPTATNMSFAGTVDVAAGDFNGDGVDELVISTLEWRINGTDFLTGEPTISTMMNFVVAAANPDFSMNFLGRTSLSPSSILGDVAPPYARFGDLPSRTRIEVVPGLFKFDPTIGYDLNRRQFAAVWNPPKFDGLGVATFDISDDLSTISTGDNDPMTLPGRAGQQFSVAAGAFKGNASIQSPEWSLALSSWSQDKGFFIQMIGISGLGTSFGPVYDGYAGAGQPYQNLPLVAYDADGDSLYLGAPVHIMVEGTVNTDFVLQEPPKHAFYDNRATILVNNQPVTNTAYGKVVNVSRFDETNVALKTSTSTTFSGKSTDRSNWSIGGSVEASAGSTAQENTGIESAKLSVDLTAKVSYDYNRDKDNYNSNYSSRTVSLTEQTDHDDKLIGRLQTYDIWRYRVYGGSPIDQPSNHAFYDIILPGPILPFDAGGLDFDWYQPTYENGNILSYPQIIGGKFAPPDIGSHKVPCPATPPSGQTCNDDGTLTVSGALREIGFILVDGTSGTVPYDYSNKLGSGNSVSYSHTLAESLDVKVAYKASVSDGVTSGQNRGSVDVGFHNSNSWGNTTTSDYDTTSDIGITLSRASGDSTQAYGFIPVFYTAKDGTIKVSHGVDVLGSGLGKQFWSGLYGGKADPALNLPSRFTPVYGPYKLTGWKPNISPSRKRMRGFFLRKAELNPVTNDYDYISQTLQASGPSPPPGTPAGDMVRVEARVYNYSTAVGTGSFNVRFQVIGYKSGNDTETPLTACPGGATPVEGRCTIGEATIIALNPLDQTVAAIVWDTTGYGPSTAGASAEYRVYVVLDPPDDQHPNGYVDEIYETENLDVTYQCQNDDRSPCSLPAGVDPGQNNEGYGYATVTAPPGFGATPNAALGADVSLREDSLAASNHLGSIIYNNILAEIFRPLRLRVKVHSDRGHSEFAHLLVYDGDPEQGGRMIAAKLVHSGNAAGSHVWFEWIPRSLGQHTRYAKLVEKFGDSKPGNNVATITVNVVPADNTPPQLLVNVSPDRLFPPNGQMIPVTAQVTVSDNEDSRPDVRLEAITHNEANDAAVDVSGADFGADDRGFSLRAARSGKSKQGRIYEVVYSATDWAGNKTYAKAYVTVPHDQGK